MTHLFVTESIVNATQNDSIPIWCQAITQTNAV